MKQEEFYKRCAEIFGVDIPYNEIILAPMIDWDTGTLHHRYTAASRWSGRNPGNGRIEGYGIVRWFSSEQIHVALKNPRHHQIYKSAEDALTGLEKLLENVKK
jgi:hypothetical protein